VTRKPARGGESLQGLAELERQLGHTFTNPDLARQALTHRSFNAAHNASNSSATACSTARSPLSTVPAASRSDLSRLRAALVNQASDVAMKLGPR
jgi:ribonuclease-3